MVAAVHAAVPDAMLLRRALGALQQEHAYWNSGAKCVVLTSADGETHTLSRYWAAWDQPRPESYRCAACLPACPNACLPAGLAWPGDNVPRIFK